MALPIVPQSFDPGFRLIDGTKLNSVLAQGILGSQTGMAANGTTFATGTLITQPVANFTTVASGGIAILPAAVPGLVVFVFNNGANMLTMNGLLSTDTIDGSASATLTVAHRGAQLTCVAAGVWISALIGAATS